MMGGGGEGWYCEREMNVGVRDGLVRGINVVGWSREREMNVGGRDGLVSGR